MRNNTGAGNKPRDKRMLGHLSKAMDRTNDNVIHRIRGQSGNERINSHRGAPTGPRGQIGSRGGITRTPNNRPNGFGGMPVPGTAASNVMNMTPQAQMELYSMLEQQSRLMATMLAGQPQHQGGFGRGGSTGGFSQPQNGRSLFDRVQVNPQRPQSNTFKKAPYNNKFGESKQQDQETPSSSMDVEMSQEKTDTTSPDTICSFNLYCRRKDCPMAHQSPAAPAGSHIDVTDVCSFGAACKNFKCTGRHPSPAQKIAHQSEVDCKYYPNCTNGSKCPFRHPTMPLCRNGADCTVPNCKFTHSKVLCKFNPCTNQACTFKHAEGQKKGKFEDKVWVADSVKEHVSERKFVDEADGEELIKPLESIVSQGSSSTAELVT